MIQLPLCSQSHFDTVSAQLHQTNPPGYMHAYTSCTMKHFTQANCGHFTLN